MAGEWVQVLSSPAVTTALSALAVLGGVALGSRLTTRRERWTAKRDAYVGVLGGLQQIRFTYRRMEAFYRVRLPTADATALQEEIWTTYGPEFKEARGDLIQAIALAHLMLSARAVEALDEYNVGDAVAAETPGLFGKLDARRGAAEKAFEALVVIARDELKVNGVLQRLPKALKVKVTELLR